MEVSGCRYKCLCKLFKHSRVNIEMVPWVPRFLFSGLFLFVFCLNLLLCLNGFGACRLLLAFRPTVELN